MLSFLSEKSLDYLNYEYYSDILCKYLYDDLINIIQNYIRESSSNLLKNYYYFHLYEHQNKKYYSEYKYLLNIIQEFYFSYDIISQLDHTKIIRGKTYNNKFIVIAIDSGNLTFMNTNKYSDFYKDIINEYASNSYINTNVITFIFSTVENIKHLC